MAPSLTDTLLAELRDDVRELRREGAETAAVLARLHERLRSVATREDLSTAIEIHCRDRHGRDSGPAGPRIAWASVIKAAAALAAIVAAAVGGYAGGAP